MKKNQLLVKLESGKPNTFKGIEFLVLSHGENSMITKMLYKDNQKVPLHKHNNEQSGYVISGTYLLKFLDYEEIINAGDSYTIPANVEHSLQVKTPGVIIDFFTPVREDYL